MNFKAGDKIRVLPNLKDFLETNRINGYYYDNAVISDMLDNIDKVLIVLDDYTFINRDSGVLLDDGCKYPPLCLELVTDEKTNEIELIL